MPPDAPLHEKDHPCRPCGACCAFLRIHFPRGDGPHVPRQLTEPTLPDHVRMRRRADGACLALDGSPGTFTTCTIHGIRPEPCRAFQPSTAAEINPYCDDARARIGLPPLRDL
jgi:Fe-S-cluster containining protein